MIDNFVLRPFIATFVHTMLQGDESYCVLKQLHSLKFRKEVGKVRRLLTCFSDMIRVKVKSYTIKRRKDSWVGHTWRRNYLLNHVTEGIIKGMGRRRRRRQLLGKLRKLEDIGT
jgi:hypothetical protein